MATNREEIIVRAGYDGSALATGLRQSGSAVKDFAREVGRDLLAVFSAGAIYSRIDSIFQKVRSLRSGAEKTGINVVDYQKLSAVANEELPDGAAKFDTAITKLNVKIGQGSKEFAKWKIHAKDAEGAMYEIADRMKAMTDPAERAAMAVDLMGRGGADLVPLLERGAVALKAMAAAKPGWSEADMKAIEDAHKNIESASNYMTLWLGKAISAFGGFFSELGRMSAFSDGDSAERGMQREQAILDIQKAKDAQEFAVEAAKEKADWEEQAARSARLAQEAITEAAAQAEKKAKALEAGYEFDKKSDKLNRDYSKLAAERDKLIHDITRGGSPADNTPFLPSLEELAGNRFSRGLKKQYGTGGQFDVAGGSYLQGTAQELELKQYQLAYDVSHGAGDGQLKQDQTRITQLKNVLAAAGFMAPDTDLADMSEHLEDVKESMAGLVKMAMTTGITIK